MLSQPHRHFVTIHAHHLEVQQDQVGEERFRGTERRVGAVREPGSQLLTSQTGSLLGFLQIFWRTPRVIVGVVGILRLGRDDCAGFAADHFVRPENSAVFRQLI